MYVLGLLLMLAIGILIGFGQSEINNIKDKSDE